ncbi:germin-like protein 9-3 [Magnolia sinica]|uniref:germin-like protein 9-3 n=1 Tax=Magnolia sinica TaxID=86752 RepID=UPI002657BA9A|nr:germin-like protein 9-3 [Magnolia sinica]
MHDNATNPTQAPLLFRSSITHQNTSYHRTMASNILSHTLFLLVTTMATYHMAYASDPDITSDFIIPANRNSVNGTFFTFTGMRAPLRVGLPKAFNVTKASLTQFPALDGQSVSYALLQYPSKGVNPPHTHPRAAELLLVIAGCLEVGFVDTTNKLYTQTLQTGDMFIFPKGLVHYQYNAHSDSPATAISAFGSANAGTVSIPSTIFATGIDDGILATAFKTDIQTVQKLKAGLAPPKA